MTCVITMLDENAEECRFLVVQCTIALSIKIAYLYI
jgi:hypothetical protein